MLPHGHLCKSIDHLHAFYEIWQSGRQLSQLQHNNFGVFPSSTLAHHQQDKVGQTVAIITAQHSRETWLHCSLILCGMSSSVDITMFSSAVLHFHQLFKKSFFAFPKSAITKFGSQHCKINPNKTCFSGFWYAGRFAHNAQMNLMEKSPNRKWGHTSATVWRIQTKLRRWVKDRDLTTPRSFV